MDSNKIKALLVLVVALCGAIYLGISAATAQFETVAWVLGGITLITCLALGRKIWLLIPFLGSLQLTLMIPGTPTTMIVGQVLVIGFTVLLFLTRQIPIHLRFSELEWWAILLGICVLQVYLRNPVGLSFFGDAKVGGRPYILFGMTAITALILCALRVPPKELKIAFRLSIIGGLLNFAVGLVGWIFPSMGRWLGVATTTTQSNTVEGIMDDRGRVSQLSFIVHIPILLARIVSSFVNPIRACFSIRWAPLVLLSFALAGASGYRNVIGAVGLTYLVGLYYRGRLISVFAAGLMGVLAVAMLAFVNVAIPLPPNIQRSLAFLPGTWEERYVLNTQNSTDWRVEMWEEALLTDRWIQNKLLGDGLGFSAKELEYQAQLMATKGGGARIGMSGFDLSREYVMVSGDYHSGPVSTIRTIGYVGLLVLAIAQLRLAIHAHRQILRCKGTEWYPIAFFFCIPIIWNPIFFWLIFGAFQIDSVFLLMGIGMIRLLENNLPLPAYTHASTRPDILMANRAQSNDPT